MFINFQAEIKMAQIWLFIYIRLDFTFDPQNKFDLKANRCFVIRMTFGEQSSTLFNMQENARLMWNFFVATIL